VSYLALPCQGNNALAAADNLSPNKNQHHAFSFDFIIQLSLDFRIDHI